jgi:hypothetical protein
VIPESIQVGPICYRVEHSEAAIAAYNHKYRESNCIGSAVHTKPVITLGEDIGHDVKVHTLLHEVIHAVLAVYDLRDREADEHFVDVIATGLLDLLRRNPTLVQCLTEAGS